MESQIRKILIYSFLIVNGAVITALLIAKSSYTAGVTASTASFILYSLLENKYRLNISNYIRANVVLTITFHNFLGKYLNLYVRSFLFDNPLHVYGNYSFTLFFYALIAQVFHPQFRSQWSKFLYIVLLGISLGLIFELGEFVLDIISQPIIPNQQGLNDTNFDMLFDLCGSIIAAVHLTWVSKERLF